VGGFAGLRERVRFLGLDCIRTHTPLLTVGTVCVWVGERPRSIQVAVAVTVGGWVRGCVGVGVELCCVVVDPSVPPAVSQSVSQANRQHAGTTTTQDC